MVTVSAERPLLHARAGLRVIVAAGVGIVVFATTVIRTPWQVAVLTGWDAASAVVVLWVLTATWKKTSAETADLATKEDDSRAAADLVIIAAAVASLAAVAFGLVEASGEHGDLKGVITAIA